MRYSLSFFHTTTLSTDVDLKEVFWKVLQCSPGYSCLSLPSDGITDMYHYAQKVQVFERHQKSSIFPGWSYMPREVSDKRPPGRNKSGVRQAGAIGFSYPKCPAPSHTWESVYGRSRILSRMSYY